MRGAVFAFGMLCAVSSAAETPLLLSKAQLHGGAEWRNVDGMDTLLLPDFAHALIDAGNAISTKEGTVLAWVKPRWSRSDINSHVLLTLPWKGDTGGYLALSHGWWEPAGSAKLYFVLSNREHAFCYTPGKFDHALFLQGQWTMVAATWKAGDPGSIGLYVDGHKVCERRIKVSGSRESGGKLFVGNDSGATDRRERASDFDINRLTFESRALSDLEILARYRADAGVDAHRRKWLTALIPGSPVEPLPGEQRAIFDEDPHWLDSPLEIQRTIKRVKAAGFNVYIPCVWNGQSALFDSKLAPTSARFRQAKNAAYDPLRYLIETARRHGVQVHLWFHVARRATDALPAEYSRGAPTSAFNVHNPAFREFIVALMVEAAGKYEIDGVNLDYIRSMGVCSSDQCKQDYRQVTGRNLEVDIDAQRRGEPITSIAAWNARAVTAIVGAAAQRLRSVSPGLHLSVDTIANDRGRFQQGVDINSWIKSGMVDTVFHMAYETPLDIAQLDATWRDLPAGRLAVLIRNYDHVGGKVFAHPGVLVADGLRLTRSRWPGASFGLYHFPHLTPDQIASLHNEAGVESGALHDAQ